MKPSSAISSSCSRCAWMTTCLGTRGDAVSLGTPISHGSFLELSLISRPGAASSQRGQGFDGNELPSISCLSTVPFRACQGLGRHPEVLGRRWLWELPQGLPGSLRQGWVLLPLRRRCSQLPCMEAQGCAAAAGTWQRWSLPPGLWACLLSLGVQGPEQGGLG